VVVESQIIGASSGPRGPVPATQGNGVAEATSLRPARMRRAWLQSASARQVGTRPEGPRGGSGRPLDRPLVTLETRSSAGKRTARTPRREAHAAE
jgi:hypothetical protein